MTDHEKLFRLLLKAFSLHSTIGLDWNDCSLFFPNVKFQEAIDYLLENGVTVRQPQKPLTVEELMEIPGSVWYENDTAIAPMMVSNQKSFSVLYLKDVVFGLYRSSAFDSFASLELPILDYGKTWRCWAEKPTEEERRAAEWLK